MSHIEIAKLIDSTLSSLMHRIDDLELDGVDLETADGKLVVEFDDGIKLIVSRQSAADQIWLAEPNGGWHYSYRDGAWIDDKRGIELVATIETLMREKLGENVVLQ